jgi:hypothetical protein
MSLSLLTQLQRTSAVCYRRKKRSVAREILLRLKEREQAKTSERFVKYEERNSPSKDRCALSAKLYQIIGIITK